MSLFKEFKSFAMRGNVVDMAVGIIIGVAFGTIVNSLVKDVIMPPIGLALGKVDFSNLFVVLKQGAVPPPYASVADAAKAGAVSINYGLFVNTIINFVIVAFAVFMLISMVNKAKSRVQPPAAAAVPTTKACPYCLSTIPIKATKCAFCTADLK
jgi:large conductance mechanosensitive channel